MRIGILTLPQETNYGGILQTFALQYTLRKMGHEAITIDRHRRRGYSSLFIHIGSFISRQIKFYIFRKNVSTKWIPYPTEEENIYISKNIQRFIDRNVELTRRIYIDQIEEIETEYQFDAYVVGSDQVWLDYYCPNSFLDFVRRPSVKRIAYAASCGKRSFFDDENKLTKCRELAQKFIGISVREESLQKLCKEKLYVDAKWVLDPTMLLTETEYRDASTPSKTDEPIIFSYILDQCEYKRNIIKEIADKFQLPTIEGNAKQYYVKNAKVHIEDCVYPSVDDWLNNMLRAKFVVTDSFHGTVFSILFNKPFLTIGNASRGMWRFKSLLKMFDLNSRLIEEMQAINIDDFLSEEINYERVNRILDSKRRDSLDFLANCLS